MWDLWKQCSAEVAILSKLFQPWNTSCAFLIRFDQFKKNWTLCSRVRKRIEIFYKAKYYDFWCLCCVVARRSLLLIYLRSELWFCETIWKHSRRQLPEKRVGKSERSIWERSKFTLYSLADELFVIADSPPSGLVKSWTSRAPVWLRLLVRIFQLDKSAEYKKFLKKL